jgi:hypothetical protein
MARGSGEAADLGRHRNRTYTTYRSLIGHIGPIPICTAMNHEPGTINYSSNAAWAAARRAIGTRNGLQLT